MRYASVLLVVVMSCKGGGGGVGGSSPEAPLKELDTATMTGDANAIRHALVSPDRLRKALDCPADSTLFSDLAGALDAASEAAKVMKDAKPKVEQLEIKQTGATKIAKGDNFRGCTAREAFEVRNYSMRLRLTALGHSEEIDDRGDVMQLDGRWYALLKD